MRFVLEYWFMFMRRDGWMKTEYSCGLRCGNVIQEAFIKNKACLIYDMFKAHLVEPVKWELLSNINTDVAIIPRSQLQPLDVSINKPFKEKVLDGTELHQ